MHAAAEAGSRDEFSAWLAASLAQLAGNAPGIVPLMAALAGLGKLAAEGEVTHLATLHQDANDYRWRVLEAVEMALQRIGERDVEWCMRTALTGICAPAQLTAPESAVRALELPEAITASLLCEVDRHAEPFRVWRQAFGYGGACHWLQLARRARAIPALGY